MKTRIPTLLALYKLGKVSEKEVIEWADDKLRKESEPFDFVSTLSLEGPDKCMKMPEYEFPRARVFSFKEEFAFRIINLNENYDVEVDSFVAWVSQAAMGLDINEREVHLGYLVDHYFNECDDFYFANSYLKNEIKDLLPLCVKRVEKIWQEIT